MDEMHRPRHGHYILGLAWASIPRGDGRADYYHMHEEDGRPAYRDRFDFTGDFSPSEELAPASKDGRNFYINIYGERAHDFDVDYAGPFYRGVALVQLNGESFYIRPDGTRVEVEEPACSRV